MNKFRSSSAHDRLGTHARARVCEADGCDTILSRYNPTDRCGAHVGDAPPVSARTAFARPRRDRSVENGEACTR